MGVNTKSSKGASGGGPTKGRVPPWAEPLVRISDWAYPYFLWVGGISLFALLTTVMFGKTEAGWLNTVMGTFAFFTIAGFLMMFVACHSTLVPGWVGAVLGAAMLFGGNILISFLAAQGKVPKDDAFLTSLYGLVPNSGIFILAASVVRLMIGFTLAVIYEQTGKDSKKFKYSDTAATSRPGAFPKCWQMSRCRPGVRASCPNYTDHVTCWKRRSGCFCDRNLANFLVSVSDRKDTSEVNDMARNVANVDKAGTGAIRGHMQAASKRPWLQQRRLCHECPLFLEHQEYKYRAWHWISFPFTVALMVAAFPYFHIAYEWMANFLDQFMAKLVEIGRLPDNFNPDASQLTDSPFEYVLLFMVGLVVGSYIVALVDKAFLDWKL